MYYIPHNRNPDLTYVKYSSIEPKYKSYNHLKRFEESSLPKKDVEYREFMKTISLASVMMKNFRGKVLFYDLILWGIMGLGLLLVIIIGIATSGNIGTMLVCILFYLVAVGISYQI